MDGKMSEPVFRAIIGAPL